MRMQDLVAKVDAAAEAVRQRVAVKPRFGVILGTGLGGLSEAIEGRTVVPYDEIPGFPVSTVASHAGEMVLGTIEGKPVVAMEGRFHCYEGYSAEEVALPVRVLRRLGVEILMISNAAGGMNPQYATGDIMIIEDHINLMGVNPLIGRNDDRLGPRFPDMCAPYDRALIDLAGVLALEAGIRTHKGVYVAVTGPNLETRAEYRFLRTIGADAVGMSTVPEVIVGVHGGLRILGLSCITDLCLPDALAPANIEEIIRVAGEAGPKMVQIMLGVIRKA
jgi:purine-nucleoside phosphorylase